MTIVGGTLSAMRVVLAHGASGNAASMRPWVEGLERRGIETRAIDLPVRRAEDVVDQYEAAAQTGPDVVIGGQSYGGRVASLLAARVETRIAGLILLCYPLHPPGRPDSLRAEQLARIRCPVLFLSGERDPLARIELLRKTVASELPSARMVTYPGVGHSLRSIVDKTVDEMAVFIEGLVPD
jgi:predicted alpha/beta-hydrolase family hydrolase